jgi:predicted PurR-regulated permease PerM
VILSGRERTALSWTILLLPVIALGISTYLVASVASAFSGILVMFFLAWLLAFVIDPVVSRIVSRLPFLPRGAAAGLVLVATVMVAIAVLAVIASSVVSSLSAITGTAATFDDAIGRLLGPVQAQIDAFGVTINLTRAASDLVTQLNGNARDLLAAALNGGLQLFSAGSSVIFIAVVFVASKASFKAYLQRLVPAHHRVYYDEFVAAVSRSFGGFIRGQFITTALYGLVAGSIGFIFGVPFVPLILVVTAALQGVPYFGQLVSWIPLVLITAVFEPSVIIPVTVTFAILLLIVQNVVAPRVMANTVGLNPVLVLAAVFIGSQVAGVFGAMFGVPVLAVLVSLFETWLDEARPEIGDVAATGDGGGRDPSPERRNTEGSLQTPGG